MTYLKSISPWLDVSDVNPLAINVVCIGVCATRTNALVTKVGTLEDWFYPRNTVVIFQTERGFVPLGHPVSICVYDVVVSKYFHAMIVPEV